jgi:MobA/MobL family
VTASYFLHVKTFSRGKGSSVTKAAAYRAGERIRDERSGAVHDYTKRTDVAHAEIVLPEEYGGRAELDWARNRSSLWNAAQQSGKLWNSRIGREVLVLMPEGLTPAQRATLVRTFSRNLAERYHSAVDFAVHRPRERADPRHHHAHLLMTTRQVGPGGLGARTTLELSGTERHARELGPSKGELLWIRERWAGVANEALREAGLAVRIDHRSYRAQGIDREPRAWIPQRILYAERRSGQNSPAGDDIRARYRERLEARLKGGAALARVVERQRVENHRRALARAEGRQVQEKIPQGALTREQLNERRREYSRANAEEINRKQRERRRANADEVNRKQREYNRKRYAAQKEAKRVVAGLEPSPVAKTRVARVQRPSPTPRVRAPAVPDPAQSARNWLAYREKLNKSPAAEPLKNWLAYREEQRRVGLTRSSSKESTRERVAVRDGPARERGGSKNSKRDRGNDYGL